MGAYDLEERRRYADRLRRITFFGVLLSTVATIASVIIVPLVYGYIQRIQSSLVTELELCRTESSRMWNEYTVTTQVTLTNFFVFFIIKNSLVHGHNGSTTSSIPSWLSSNSI